MDFHTAAKYASLLSKEYAEDIFMLLVNYQAISASEVATRLNLHIKTAQDFLESLEQLDIVSKEEILEKKRPYYRYILNQTRLLIDIDLTSNLEANEANCQWKYTGVQGPEDPDRWVCSDIPYFDDSYSGHDYDALNIDPHGILFEEQLQIEVRSFGSLIDSFTA